MGYKWLTLCTEKYFEKFRKFEIFFSNAPYKFMLDSGIAMEPFLGTLFTPKMYDFRRLGERKFTDAGCRDSV